MSCTCTALIWSTFQLIRNGFVAAAAVAVVVVVIVVAATTMIL